MCFIISGALGNIFDRIRLGYVVDIISWQDFTVFNIADIFYHVWRNNFIVPSCSEEFTWKSDLQSK